MYNIACIGILSDLNMLIWLGVCPHLYGRGFGVHNFLVHTDRHHNGIDFAKLIFCFLRNKKRMI